MSITVANIPAGTVIEKSFSRVSLYFVSPKVAEQFARVLVDAIELGITLQLEPERET